MLSWYYGNSGSFMNENIRIPNKAILTITDCGNFVAELNGTTQSAGYKVVHRACVSDKLHYEWVAGHRRIKNPVFRRWVAARFLLDEVE